MSLTGRGRAPGFAQEAFTGTGARGLSARGLVVFCLLSVCAGCAADKASPVTSGDVATPYATGQSESRSVEAGATQNVITDPIDATYTDRFGWTWHLNVTELPWLTATTDISQSPPGSARVVWTLTGGIQASLENVDSGRTPPDWVIDDAQMQVHYHYGTGTDYAPSVSTTTRTTYPVCTYGVGEVECWAGQIYPDDYALDEQMDLGTTSSEDVKEAQARHAAAAFSDDSLSTIRFRGVGCSLEVTPSTGAVEVYDDAVGSASCRLK